MTVEDRGKSVFVYDLLLLYISSFGKVVIERCGTVLQ